MTLFLGMRPACLYILYISRFFKMARHAVGLILIPVCCSIIFSILSILFFGIAGPRQCHLHVIDLIR